MKRQVGPDERETRPGHQGASSNSSDFQASAGAHDGPEACEYDDDGEEDFVLDESASMDPEGAVLDGRDAVDWAREYARRGWSPIPLPPRAKRCARTGWPELRIGEAEVPSYFDARSNVGVLLGEPSGELSDVDLDCAETRALADALLPATSSSFGRASTPRSHRLYVARGAATIKYCDPNLPPDEAMLVELRSTGAQTMFPGSIHPGGESVEWAEDREPAEIDADELRRAIARLAAAALLVRGYPGRGGRHDYVLAVAGALARTVPEVDAETMLLAIARTAGDEEAYARRADLRSTLRRLAAERPATGWPTLARVIGEPRAQKVREWLGGDCTPSGAASDGDEQLIVARPSQSTLLVRLADDVELFHAPDDEPYATLSRDGHRETHHLRSRALRDHLVRAYYVAHGRAPRAESLREALGVLAARARYDGAEHPVWLRVAEHAGAIYLDLGDATRRAVEVAATGWRIVAAPPVRFRRAATTLALPEPVRGGSLAPLRQLVRVESADDWHQLVGWLLAAMRPRGPYPVLALGGEPGATKSTTARILRALVDPCVAPLRSEPREPRDLIVAARNGHVVALDNVSHVKPWLSDSLCRLSTGGGYSARELYSDLDEVVVDVQRPVIVTAIEEVCTRSDLADRALVITLPAMPADRRLPERQLAAAVERARPVALGALLDAVACGLRELPSVSLADLPRMADYATWLAACEPALSVAPGTMVAAYARGRQSVTASTLEASAVGCALLAWLAPGGVWEGTTSALLATLTERVDEVTRRDRHRWPQQVQGMTGALRRLAPALRAAGVRVDWLPRTARTRTLRITREDPSGGAASASHASYASSGTPAAGPRDDELDERRGTPSGSSSRNPSNGGPNGERDERDEATPITAGPPEGARTTDDGEYDDSEYDL